MSYEYAIELALAQQRISRMRHPVGGSFQRTVGSVYAVSGAWGRPVRTWMRRPLDALQQPIDAWAMRLTSEAGVYRDEVYWRFSNIERLETRWTLSGSPADVPYDFEIPLAAAEASIEAGEAPDLVGFAQALTDAGVTFFGAAWCPECTAQKALFEDGAQFLPFVEVTLPSRSRNQVGLAENIDTYPTWQQADGTRIERGLSLEELSEFTGIEMPTSSQPFVAPIGDVTLLSGSPLHIPLDGYDPNGGPLTFTVTSSNESLVSTFIPEGNRSWSFDAGTYGQMVFELFEGRSPRATERIIELTENGFYEGVYFHRIIRDFVIQGGDPTADPNDSTRAGRGGSDLGVFDDQFHLDLQHNRSGILSMAKGFDDTNDSQFFITAGDTRALDFNHTIFGQLIEGEAVREAMSQVPTTIEFPKQFPVDMTSVKIFQDEENRALMLSAKEGRSGEADITVRVTDQDGNEFVDTFHVTVEPDVIPGLTNDDHDVSDGQPFLADIPEIRTTLDTPVTFQLTAFDIEGDRPTYLDEEALADLAVFSPVLNPAVIPVRSVADLDYSVNPNSGLVTVTPRNGLLGVFEITVAVADTREKTFHFGPGFTQVLDGADAYDYQIVPITIALAAPGNIRLSPSSDSGTSQSDQITNQNTLEIEVDGLDIGALITLRSGDEVIGAAVVNGTNVTITADNPSVLLDGLHTITATQTIGEAESERSTALEVQIDLTAPDFSGIDLPGAQIDQRFELDLISALGGETGLEFSLLQAPAGMTLDERSGLLEWTPDDSQQGNHDFEVTATDLAGNSTSQLFTVGVGNLPPTIEPIGNATIPEGELYTFTAIADDPNLPNDTLTFSLGSGAPLGAQIDPQTGVFTWTPTEEEGPNLYRFFAVRVTDGGGEVVADTFQILVTEVNQAPVVDAIEDQLVNRGEALEFDVTGSDPDIDNPEQLLRFDLTDDAPRGASIDPDTGRFVWTPSGDLADDTIKVTVIVTDTANEPLSASRSFNVTINEPPELEPVENRSVREEALLQLTFKGSDVNLPVDTLKYSLDPGAPTGAAVDPDSGLFTWRPGELDGPGTHEIGVSVTDAQGLSATRRFAVDVEEVNRPPVLEPIVDQRVPAGSMLQLTAKASDPDIPAKAVRYSLEPGAPEGATVHPTTGDFRWTPDRSSIGMFDFTLRATDVDDDTLISSQLFRVRVAEPVAADNFGISLAVRSTQVDAAITPPVRTLDVPLVSGNVPQRRIPFRVPFLSPNSVRSRNEMNDVGAGGGKVSIQKKSLARPKDADAKTTPADEQKVPADEAPGNRRRANKPVQDGLEKQDEDREDDFVIDRAISDVVLELARE